MTIELDPAEAQYLRRLVEVDLAARRRRYERPHVREQRAAYFARPENAGKRDASLHRIRLAETVQQKLDLDRKENAA